MRSFDDFKRTVLQIVQPLSRGTVNKTESDNIKMTGLIPEGTKENFTNGSLYGISSKVPKGVFGFFQNLFGTHDAPVIIAHLDSLKPKATKDGQIIFYCRKPNGTTFPVTMDFDPDGKLNINTNEEINITSPTVNVFATNVKVESETTLIDSSTKIQVKCDDVEVGSSDFEKVVNGETYKTFYNEHMHTDFFGLPVQPPIVPMTDEEHLSSQVKAGK